MPLAFSTHVRPSTPGDAAFLAPRLREADLKEIHGRSPLDTLRFGLEVSRLCLTAVSPRTGEPMAMIGVMPTTDRPDIGVVWMLGTDEITAHPLLLMRLGQPGLEVLHQHFPILVALPDARNKRHTDWLHRLGFTLLKVHEVEGRPVCEFAKIQEAPAYV